MKSEAALYLDLPSVPLDADELEWWALNEMKFPALTPRSWPDSSWASLLHLVKHLPRPNVS